MHRRFEHPVVAPYTRPIPADALRQAWRRGYRLCDLRADLLAGVVVGVVALPLSMALAIASGVPPQHGLYTAIVAGAVIAALGGSPVQVSGPTAAFVVILAPIAGQYGLAGLLLASLLAGVLLSLMGLARLGRLIEFVPYPVTAGFTAGIAIVIATLQLKDLLGLSVTRTPEHYLERVHALFDALYTLRSPDFAVGVGTLLILLVAPRITKRIPAPLIALPLAAAAAAGLAQLCTDFRVETIGTRFGGIPPLPPLPALPWKLPGPDGRPLVLSLDTLRELVPSAFAIAMLGAIESLLSAVVADGMTGSKHNPDAELLAQGTGNLIAPFFGGFAATGAIARTATNIRSGARSPIAAITHAAFVLLSVVALAPLLGYLPMAALAALLLVVAWNMAEVKHLVHVLRVAPRADVLVLLTCLLLTVVFDMVVSVTVGVVLAALLFMQRMSELTGAKVIDQGHPSLAEPLPPGVLLYEVAGPLFFGAAQKAMSALQTVAGDVSLVLIDLRSVPTMDATGLISFESALEKLHRARIFTIIAGIQKQPLHLIAKAGWRNRHDWLAIYSSFDDGLALARLAIGAPPRRS